MIDIDEIVALDQQVLKDYDKSGHPAVDAEARRKALANSLYKSEFVSVRRGELLVAYVYFWPMKDDNWFVGGLAVHLRHRDPSVFRSLLLRARAKLQGVGACSLQSHVFKANIASVRLHYRLGFEVTQQNDESYAFTLTNNSSLIRYSGKSNRKFTPLL